MSDVIVTRHDTWAEIGLNRPARRNAITDVTAAELRDALVNFKGDTGINSLVIYGEGPSFCSGMDLKALGPDGPEEARQRFPVLWTAIHETLLEMPMPLIIALEGAAMNAGAALALSGDLLIAAKSSFIQVGEPQMGMPATRNAAWLVLRHGEATAMRFVLMADRVGADELLRRGVALELVDDGAALTRVRAIAQRIAGFPDGARKAKAAVRLTTMRKGAQDWFGPAVAADPPRAFTPVRTK
ncbi:MAG: enoyl-CoA hydratase/isomerase family protein [Burkholderiales bacterium]